MLGFFLVLSEFCSNFEMDKLPMNDVPMLVSAINFLLRDHEFETLDEICNHFNVNRAALEAKMATQGFEWSEQQKKFW